jgi:hypothetical protein
MEEVFGVWSARWVSGGCEGRRQSAGRLYLGWEVVAVTRELQAGMLHGRYVIYASSLLNLQREPVVETAPAWRETAWASINGRLHRARGRPHSVRSRLPIPC